MVTSEDTVNFVFEACRFFGASLSTSHKVAALVAEEVERIEKSKNESTLD